MDAAHFRRPRRVEEQLDGLALFEQEDAPAPARDEAPTVSARIATAPREEADASLRVTTHGGGFVTERAAALANQHGSTSIKGMIVAALALLGPMTDWELVHLPQFAKRVADGTLDPNTIRCRRKDLYNAGQLEACGERAIAKDPARPDRLTRFTLWRIAERREGA